MAITIISSADNDGEHDIVLEAPYAVEVTIRGTSALLLHRYSATAVAEKGKAKKGSEAKKSDNVESYVYRNDDGEICLPGVYLIGTMIDPRNGAAKYRQDPRSPRKSALDLFRAGIVSLTELAPIMVDNQTSTDWEYIDARRVIVQRNAITRERPAFRAGWTATFQINCLSPEYITPALLHDVLGHGGRLVGLGDFRPTFGRFQIDLFQIL